MKFLDFFKTPKRTAALVAKERLQIIVSHESSRKSKDFIKDLQRELLEVISKYVDIDPEQIKVQLEQHGDQSVLELNVTLSDQVKETIKAPKVDAQAKPATQEKPSDTQATEESKEQEASNPQAQKTQKAEAASEQA